MTLLGFVLGACLGFFLARRGLQIRQVYRLIAPAEDFTKPPIDGRVAVRFFGDSIAQSVGATAWRHTMAAHLDEFIDGEVDVRARYGMRIRAVADQITNDAYTQDLAVIFCGGIDVQFHTTKHYQADIKRLLSVAAEHSQKVIIFVPSYAVKMPGYPWWARPILGARSLQLERAIVDAAAEHSNVVVLNLMERTGRDKALFEAKYFASDGVHPNDDSYGIWAQ